MQGTDALHVKAGAHAALGEAQAASGRPAEAAHSFLEAARLYEEKGNIVLGAAARAAAQPDEIPSRSSTRGSGSSDRAGGT